VELSTDVAFFAVPSNPDVGEEKRKWYVLCKGPPRHCSALSTNLRMGGTTAGEDEGRLNGVESQGARTTVHHPPGPLQDGRFLTALAREVWRKKCVFNSKLNQHHHIDETCCTRQNAEWVEGTSTEAPFGGISSIECYTICPNTMKFGDQT